jgi:hypothetical protein
VADIPVVIGRVCSDCEHALFGPGGVYCRLYNEDIWQEKVAEECADFDPLPWASQDAKGE